MNELTRTQEIFEILFSERSDEEIRDALSDYHENDIAEALSALEENDRKRLYRILGVEQTAEILSYTDNVSEYLAELTTVQAAKVIENMDADDAVDALENIGNTGNQEQLLKLIGEKADESIRLIRSFEDDEIGSMMTTNYVVIPENYTIKEAMRSVIRQAEKNDNITTIYTVDETGKYAGAIELKDLIVARDYSPLDHIISHSYPAVFAKEKIQDTMERLKDYSEDSIPVLNSEKEIIGVITATAITEAVDAQMSDDYAKLAGLTSEEDLNEKLSTSLKKRLPWLILLLGLGMIVSSVVGIFEAIVAEIAVIVCFQSLILDMAGNVGTQSLAVTIRVLMDENLSGKTKLKFALKEVRMGATNGLILGSLSFALVGLYLTLVKSMGAAQSFMVSGCVGLALLLAMIISSLVGTVIPMFFHKIHIDPAVASGPLITTMNDLVAVVTYYGLAGLLLSGFKIS